MLTIAQVVALAPATIDLVLYLYTILQQTASCGRRAIVCLEYFTGRRRWTIKMYPTFKHTVLGLTTYKGERERTRRTKEVLLLMRGSAAKISVEKGKWKENHDIRNMFHVCRHG